MYSTLLCYAVSNSNILYILGWASHEQNSHIKVFHFIVLGSLLNWIAVIFFSIETIYGIFLSYYHELLIDS